MSSSGGKEDSGRPPKDWEDNLLLGQGEQPDLKGRRTALDLDLCVFICLIFFLFHVSVWMLHRWGTSPSLWGSSSFSLWSAQLGLERWVGAGVCSSSVAQSESPPHPCSHSRPCWAPFWVSCLTILERSKSKVKWYMQLNSPGCFLEPSVVIFCSGERWTRPSMKRSSVSVR